MNVTIEFLGGLDALVEKQKEVKTTLPKEITHLKHLIIWIKENLMKSRQEEFVTNELQIRPGIMVLVNEIDWALLDEENYEIQQNDRIAFLSSLHGG
ncbi:rurm1 protein [Anaeramoeba ignava]|uniref:Ubiquitin-related modifier 1 homolog n=1 Tax=Anaeramoeba ignava TaxID=1746090 RepID=A0A9Q0LBZ4_ANAIG|nr:rurm1 protein [Anaeramoeba ignava]